MDYRKRLYESYISTHFSHIRDISPEALERAIKTSRHYFGRLLPQDRNASILEVGCGYGSFLNFLQTEGYQNVEGVEVSPEQVEAAQKLGITNAVCGDAIEFLRERPGRYQCIVAIDVIDHFPKEEVFDVLDAMFTGLDQGGTLILQAVNADGPFAGRLRYADFSHYFALTAISARQILETAGFEDVRIHSMDPFVHGVPSFLRVMTWKVIRALLRTYLIAETGIIHGHILTQNLIATAVKPGSPSDE